MIALNPTCGFATAHSCGLRLLRIMVMRSIRLLCHSAFVRVATRRLNILAVAILFATAHSCGLRLRTLYPEGFITTLCHSAFVRVATLAPYTAFESELNLCHSAFVRVATSANSRFGSMSRPLPQRIRAGCDFALLDCGCTPQLCHSAFVRVATAEKQCSALRICCEKVDSFSSVGESGLALTIFPFSFAAKATYVAINDSFGRAIDRFFWCEPHRN